MATINDKGSIPEPEKLTPRVSYHEGELHSQPDSTWAVSFAYFRKMSPKDALDPTFKRDEPSGKES